MDRTELPTISDFIAAHGMRMSYREADTNPNADNDGNWAANANHYRCTLTCSGRRMVVTFSKGSGHRGAAPTLAEVLDCVASDSAGVDNARSFAEWCADYGYSTDSRKAEKTWRQCSRQRASLRLLCGSQEVYEALIWRTGRE